MRKMRIAIMATNIFPTPPKGEKVIYAPLWIAFHMADRLTEKGHQVFLFGSSESKTKAKLISKDLPSLKRNKDWAPAYRKLQEKEKEIKKGKLEFLWTIKWKQILRANYELNLATEIYKMTQQGKIDIIQFHSQLNLLQLAGLTKVPVVATIHDPFSHPFNTNAVKIICKSLPKNVHLVSVSNAQRETFPKLKFAATIYNGIDIKKFSFGRKGKYLAFAGRILPQKGVEIAVKVAKKTGQNLKIAGQIPGAYTNFWKKRIKPYLSKKITYEGFLNQKEIVPFYKGAKALLMPVSWNESFGLVPVEAMACGTPVIAFPNGGLKETVADRKTGFLVKKQNIRGIIKALKKINSIKRRDCREWVKKNFGIEKMVEEYEKIYYKILNK